MSGPFGPHENNIIQSTALGCIGIVFMYISGIPAMYQLKLLNPSIGADYWRLVCFTLVAGTWALGFTVALRKMFILQLGRQLSLYFPIGTAAAVTIQTLHSSTGGENHARDNLRAMAIVFSSSSVWSVATSYAPGILYTWNPFWWFYKWGGKGAIAAVNWGWLSWSWSPSLIGMGMLIDLNASLSYLGGTVFAWAIVGPITVKTGATAGLAYNKKYPDLITYNAFDPRSFATKPSPRYWLLFPAVFMMLAVSLTTIALQSKNFLRQIQYGISNLRNLYRGRRGGDQTSPDTAAAGSLQTPSPADSDEWIADPVPKEYQVRWWEWTSVTAASTVVALAGLKFTFGFSIGINILSMVLGFIWAFIVIQVLGAAGTTPISTIAKGSQFITGAILRDQVSKIGLAQASIDNLSAASLSAGAAQQAAELVQDFRTGFLLGTPARQQWYAQLLGTLVAVFLSPGIFVLFGRAFPCILDSTITTCPFATPAVSSWRVVTTAILSPKFPISTSSWIFSIVLSVFGSATVILRWWLNRHQDRAKWTKFVPNMSLVGLAMTIPGSTSTLTCAIGSVGAHIWKRRARKSYDKYMYAIAAGGVAGEGIGYVIISILQITAVAGPTYFGTKLGCVAETC